MYTRIVNGEEGAGRDKENNSWQKFCTSIESCDGAARIRKILARDNNRTLGSLKKHDGTYTKNDKEMSETLIETHFPGCKIVNAPDWNNHGVRHPSEEDWTLANKIVTPERLTWAINTFHPFKTGGNDNIFPALLQWGQTQLTPWLTAIYKACIAYRYIPLAWREVKVIFLPKPGKSDYTLPKSFRPISLTSFLLKTLERLGDRFLRDGALRDLPPHPNQHAYNTGKSAETALHSVVTKIERDLGNKISTLGTFIDIEGAFDKTTFNSIDKALSRKYLHPTLRSWIRALLEHRIIQVDINGTTKGIVARGCPQGGVLSPILWNLVVDDLITKLNTGGFYTIGYADDIVILISGKLEYTLCEIMQRALRLIERWCKENDLSVNPKKTELVLFTNKRKPDIPKLPTLFNTSLTLSNEVKYLGVTLDSKLSWKRHIEDKTNKATIILHQCKRMLGKTWGLKPKIMN
ncbi:jg22999, partial [Pararge aegeria aegeria]